MQKIHLLVHKKDKARTLAFLQEKGVLHVTETKVNKEEFVLSGVENDSHDLQYTVAELDFAVHFLAGYEKKKKGFQAMVDGDSVSVDPKKLEDIAKNYEYKEVVKRCQSVEKEMVTLANEIKELKALEERILPWKGLPYSLVDKPETNTVTVIFAALPPKQWDAFRKKALAVSNEVLIEYENRTEELVYTEIIAGKDFVTPVGGLVTISKGELIDLPRLSGTVVEELENISDRYKKIEERQGQLTKAAKELSKDLKSLRITYDYYNWQLIQENAHKHFLATGSTVVVSGWMPKKGIPQVKSELTQVTKHFDIIEVEPEKGEQPPVLLSNKGILKPFQSVTGIYGLPLPSEMDPTPYLSVFFILFFGLALTDAVYGLLMFSVMFVVLRYLKIPKESQGMIRLLMYAGLVTFAAGAIFGGWASLDPSQVPAWMTTTDAAGKLIFVGQKISAIDNPMAVLILALVLGYIQVLFGVTLNFVHKFRTDNKLYAMIDHFPWVFILSVIGLMLMLQAGLLPTALTTVLTYTLYGAIALIVLTQGREKKNPILKLLSGILGLYGLVGYLSDVLSYSRLLALGLATSIIGLAVNTIAGMVGGVPYIGILLALVVLIIGHLFNLGINALGAFIHSGRLQFVEFFTKFLEGGGYAFKPLAKDSRYVRVQE